MTFTGFSLPDGAYLPPELIYQLPNISGSKLKAIIAILYHVLQVGGGEPLSLRDVEKYTGLSRQAVIDALRDLLEEGMIERQQVGMSYVYSPVVNFLDSGVKKLDRSKKLTGTEELRESDRELNFNLKDSLSDSLNLSGEGSEKIALLQELRAAGVYLKTAQGIVEKHAAEVIREYFGYYRYALKAHLAQGPGWLVEALKEGWGAPLGYQAEKREYVPYGGAQTEDEIRAWQVSQGICPDCEEWLSACVCEDVNISNGGKG
jgi:DNA-binding Lrp family transcriptional regulator